MKFHMPVKVYCERDCVKTYSDEWTSLGHKALIVTGRSSAKNGALADVTDSLNAHQISYCIFDHTEENPSIEMVMQVRDMGIRENVDFVIGIGGGSPMDAAKAIALMIYHKDKDADYLYQQGDSTALPIVEVPTTCGTGSEVTPISVLTIHAKRTKSSIPHRIFPQYALVDGKYLASAPKKILVNTSVDSLGHLIESYINLGASPFSRMISEYGMALWKDVKPALLSDHVTDEDRDRMMLTSTLAGMAITHAGTTLPHGLSYFLTYEMHIPHGQAVGYFQPGYVAAAAPETQAKVLELIGCKDIAEFANLIHTLLVDLSAAFGTVWCADPCIEQTEIIIDLRHCSHRRSWITVGGFLINGNGRRQSFNTLNVRLLHLS